MRDQELRNRLLALLAGPCNPTTYAEAQRIVAVLKRNEARSFTPAVDLERRVVTTFKTEVRSSAKGIGTLFGYAAVYNSLSEELRDKSGNVFRERIMPGAFNDVLRKRPDVVCLRDHKPDLILGRTSAGTLRLAGDNYGLSYECDLPDTSAGRDVRELVERGDLRGSSFAFSVGEQDWDTEGGQMRRTVRTVDALRDVSVVTSPAYESSEVGLRCSVAIAELRSRQVKEPEWNLRSIPEWRICCERLGINPDTADIPELYSSMKQHAIKHDKTVARQRASIEFLLQ